MWFGEQVIQHGQTGPRSPHGGICVGHCHLELRIAKTSGIKRTVASFSCVYMTPNISSVHQNLEWSRFEIQTSNVRETKYLHNQMSAFYENKTKPHIFTDQNRARENYIWQQKSKLLINFLIKCLISSFEIGSGRTGGLISFFEMKNK